MSRLFSRVLFAIAVLCWPVLTHASHTLPVNDDTPLAKLYLSYRDGFPEKNDPWSCNSALSYMKEVLKRFGKKDVPWLKAGVTRHIFSQAPAALKEFDQRPPVYKGRQLLDDLEVVVGKVGAREKSLVTQLDRAQTEFGTASLVLLLATPQTNQVLLKNRQQALKHLLNNSDHWQACRQQLSNLADEQYRIMMFWSWDSLSNPVNWGKKYKLPGARGLNKSSLALSLGQVYSWFKRIGGAVFAAWGTYALTMYAMHALRTRASGNKVDGPGLRKDDAQWVDNIRGGGDWDTQWIWKLSSSPWLHAPIAGLAAYFWFFGLKGTVEQGHADILFDQLFLRAMSSLSRSFEAIENLYKELKKYPLWRSVPGVAPLFTFFEQTAIDDKEVKDMLKLFKNGAMRSSVKSRLHQGVLIRGYLQFKKCQAKFHDLFTAVGRVDALSGVATLYNEHRDANNRYCFAQYASGKPQLTVIDMWNPFLSPDVAVPNNIALGGAHKTQHYLITGPNAAGKSTNLKAIALTALLAQTLGIAPATHCTLTPFHVLETYLNITDELQEGNSLFKKEVIRAGELLLRVKENNGSGKPALLVFDEMFNGTTPHEGISCAYSVAAHLAKQPNVLSTIATHFSYLTRLPNIYPNIANMRVSVTPLRSGQWHRSYKIAPGISQQHIALDMLDDEVGDNSIAAMAREVLADVSASLE